MSAVTAWQGLEEIFRRVDGIRSVVLGEPTGNMDLPALYTAFEGFGRPLAGQPPANNPTEMVYTFVHRLFIQWVDFQQAEMQLLTFINAIPAAVDADARLGGRLTGGIANIRSGDAGFITIGSVKYRIVDFTSTVREKAPRSSGL